MNVELEHRVVEFLSLFDGSPPDLKAVSTYLSPEATLANPVGHADPVRGREAIVTQLAATLSRHKSSRFKIANMASNSSQVFTERVDSVILRDGRKVEVFVCGIFDFDRSGQITAWREYWDPADAKAQLGAA
jgi:limonene-1,2-epoxide hydrolase